MSQPSCTDSRCCISHSLAIIFVSPILGIYTQKVTWNVEKVFWCACHSIVYSRKIAGNSLNVSQKGDAEVNHLYVYILAYTYISNTCYSRLEWLLRCFYSYVRKSSETHRVLKRKWNLIDLIVLVRTCANENLTWKNKMLIRIVRTCQEWIFSPFK